MRQGIFEIEIIDSKGQNLKEILLQEKNYVIANPGMEYAVKVNVYRDQNRIFPYDYLRFGLYIDGRDVRYWKRLDFTPKNQLPKDLNAPVSLVFWGFKTDSEELKSFKFANPRTTSSSSVANAKETLGNIRLEVFEANVTEGTYHNVSGQVNIKELSTVSQNEKFIHQASVVTEVGNPLEINKEKFLPLQRWTNKSKTPLQILNLGYHTQEMIRILQNIDPMNNGMHLKRSRNEPTELTLEDDEIQIIQKKKTVPFLDLSNDDDLSSAKWSDVQVDYR